MSINDQATLLEYNTLKGFSYKIWVDGVHNRAYPNPQ